jgi:hypothetical protein
MEWISAKENPPKLEKMLVFCSICGNIHSVHFDYEQYCLAECCYSTGGMFAGSSVEFEWYMPLPKPPISEESQGAVLKQDDTL